MTKELLDYFNGDDLAASVWLSKYALKDEKGEYQELLPSDMHKRMAKEFSRIGKNQKFKKIKDLNTIEQVMETNVLSEFGKKFMTGEIVLDEETVFKYFDKFKYIVPQGSIMSALGNFYKLQSLSNCFVVPPPFDSYAGIFKTDQEIAQLEKRRGGVGTNLNTLRPDNTIVRNAAGTSTGAHSFMSRYSNTTREVAQNGRRGALMLLMSVIHPDIFEFVKKKKDRTQVTGANVSVQLTHKFMKAVQEDGDFLCFFPVEYANLNFKVEDFKDYEYNKLFYFKTSNPEKVIQIMKIRAKELFDLIVEMAWDNAEPGIAFMDNVITYSPDGVYKQFKAIASNPCGEQWLQAYDACRLLALNFYSIVMKAFSEEAYIDYDLLYEISYIQQMLADLIVDLEIEYVDKIIEKIKSDPEPEEVKAIELSLWENIKVTASNSRRTGCGFTALGDMLAALNLRYDSEEGMAVIEQVMKTKLKAELDCTIDLAILKAPFTGWNGDLEFTIDSEGDLVGKNEFYEMLCVEFPDEAWRMYTFGRRNVSWSTVAPTGSVSIVTQTTSGLEPLFSSYYMRRKKVNPSDEGVRVDFVDQNGDSWTEYPVVHPKFKDWLSIYWSDADIDSTLEELKDKSYLEDAFKNSPWYKSCANDIDWLKRIDIQSIIQKYTTNAISSTLNLPNNVSKQTVADIYIRAWKKGLKGVTVYRDGCRTGVLVTESSKKSSFDYSDALKRPKELDADLHVVTVKGAKYGVLIGKIDDKPYEIFAFNLPEEIKHSSKGKITKVKKGHYDYISEEGILRDIQSAAIRNDELVLTRLISGMLRHGAKPQFVMEQIDKCDLEIVSFGKAISRTLKKYVKDEEMIQRNTCKDCGSSNVRMQEGCLTCNDCGSSKCG